MSNLYAIKDETLTALGDAIRNKALGITELPELNVENEYINYNKAYPYSMPEYVKKVKLTCLYIYMNAYEDGNGYHVGSANGAQGLGVASGSFGTYDDRIIRQDDSYEVLFEGHRGPTIVPSKTVEIETIIEGNQWAFVATRSDSSPYCFYLTFTAIGLDENGNEFKYTPLEMVDTINELKIPVINSITLTSNCSYVCAGPLASEMIKYYSDKIETKDITNMDHMFYRSTLEEIPLVLNGSTTVSNVSMGYMFNASSNLKVLPEMRNIKPGETTNIFGSCSKLREIPENFGEDWDWSYIDKLTSSYSGSRSGMFQYCSSLRKLPMKFLEHGNPNVSYSNSIYYNLASDAWNLDEIINLPFPHHNVTWTSNAFSNCFNTTGRLKEMTFALQEDGSPYVMKWKSQVVDLGSIGYLPYTSYAIQYNSGITKDKEVKDDATYQALKNDPDWFSCNMNYSRYNHDSAVNTINSLPDCSATGTNTIKFRGVMGSLTDGGAINTLTEEEIAVAAAKGWTVTFV